MSKINVAIFLETIIIFLLLSLDSISYFLIFRKFFDSYGPLLFFGSIVSYVVYIGFQLGGNFWLTVWTSDPQANTDAGVRDKYLGIFGLLGIFQVGLGMNWQSLRFVRLEQFFYTINSADRNHSSNNRGVSVQICSC